MYAGTDPLKSLNRRKLSSQMGDAANLGNFPIDAARANTTRTARRMCA